MRKVLTHARRYWRLRSATALAAVGAMTVSLGVVMLGATTAQVNADEPCVPKDAWTETINHAAVTHTETVTVVDQAAWTETIPATPGQHYSWNGGNRGVNDPPTTFPPADTANWTPNTESEPHAQGSGDPATWYPLSNPVPGVGLHVLGNSNSNASWFYYVPATAQQTINHPAVTHQESRTVVDTPAWTETINHPAVTCDVTELAPAVTFTDATCDTLGEEAWDGTLEAFLDYEATGEVGPGETVTVDAMIEAAYADEYEFAEGAETEFTHTFADITLEDCVQGEETVIPKPDKPEPKPVKEPTVKGVQVVAPPAAAPTAVAAGLAGDSGAATAQLLGQVLAGLGLVMLIAAGALAPRRVRGVHES